jgi:hypothetical protein
MGLLGVVALYLAPYGVHRERERQLSCGTDSTGALQLCVPASPSLRIYPGRGLLGAALSPCIPTQHETGAFVGGVVSLAPLARIKPATLLEKCRSSQRTVPCYPDSPGQVHQPHISPGWRVNYHYSCLVSGGTYLPKRTKAPAAPKEMP